MKWAILIPTLPRRHKLYSRVTQQLTEQIGDNPDITIFSDERLEESTGIKRNDLIKTAASNGFDYVSFVDDDDVLSDFYVKKIWAEMKKEPDAIGFDMVGKDLKQWQIRFARKGMDHNKIAEGWCHFNAIKTKIASREQFPDLFVGEDIEWVKLIKKHIRVQAYIPEVIYWHCYHTK